MQAEMLNSQLEQLEEQLEQLEEQRAEVQHLQRSLDEFSGLKGGDEIMVSLATGIFARATYSGDDELLVNVGAGTLIKKTPLEVHEDLDVQLQSMDEAEQKIRAEFEQKLHELEELQERFRDVQ